MSMEGAALVFREHDADAGGDDFLNSGVAGLALLGARRINIFSTLSLTLLW